MLFAAVPGGGSSVATGFSVVGVKVVKPPVKSKVKKKPAGGR